MACEARVTAHFPMANGYWLLRLACPLLIPHLMPGHAITIAEQTLPIAWIKHASGEIELYYTFRNNALSALREGNIITLGYPQGKPLPPCAPNTLIAAAPHQHNAALCWLAECARQNITDVLGFFDADTLPFRPQPSRILLPSLPAHVIASHPLCESWGIASRLASASERPGCYEGSVDHLVTTYTSTHPDLHTISVR
jgi:hypothetical protein